MDFFKFIFLRFNLLIQLWWLAFPFEHCSFTVVVNPIDFCPVWKFGLVFPTGALRFNGKWKFVDYFMHDVFHLVPSPNNTDLRSECRKASKSLRDIALYSFVHTSPSRRCRRFFYVTKPKHFYIINLKEENKYAGGCIISDLVIENKAARTMPPHTCSAAGMSGGHKAQVSSMLAYANNKHDETKIFNISTSIKRERIWPKRRYV